MENDQGQSHSLSSVYRSSLAVGQDSSITPNVTYVATNSSMGEERLVYTACIHVQTT